MTQQTAEIMLCTIQAYANLSGYVYLHIPNHVAKQFNINSGTNFTISYRDGKIEIVQQRKEENELLG